MSRRPEFRFPLRPHSFAHACHLASVCHAWQSKRAAAEQDVCSSVLVCTGHSHFNLLTMLAVPLAHPHVLGPGGLSDSPPARRATLPLSLFRMPMLELSHPAGCLDVECWSLVERPLHCLSSRRHCHFRVSSRAKESACKADDFSTLFTTCRWRTLSGPACLEESRCFGPCS